MQDTELILRLFHIGSLDSFGPTENLFRIGTDATITLFDTRIENLTDYDNFIRYYKDHFGIPISTIKSCLSNTIGKKMFHIGKMPKYGSFYVSNPDIRNWIVHISNRKEDMGTIRTILKWEDMSTIRNSIYMETSTIDQLYTDKKIKMPNFLSIDAQGSEYDILEGSIEALKGDVVGIVTEVEFSPIYDGQKLFSDQDAFLRQYQFYLCDIISREYWHPGPVTGIGHLTAAEALFLRDYRYFANKNKEPYLLLSNLSKLAMVAYCFGRTSYSFEIMKYIMNNWNNEWNTFKNKYNNKYLHTLAELFAILMLN